MILCQLHLLLLPSVAFSLLNSNPLLSNIMTKDQHNDQHTDSDQQVNDPPALLSSIDIARADEMQDLYFRNNRNDGLKNLQW